MAKARDAGAALIDLVFACGLVALICAIAIPSVQAMREWDSSRMAARYLASRLQALRMEAVRRNRMVAMRFDPDDLGRIGSYVDGDGDGLSQRDIDRGIDPALDGETRVADVFGSAALRVTNTMIAPEGGGVISEGSDPVRIGNSNLLSFSPLGSATSGTVYIAGPGGHQLCVRVFGATGRVRVLWFDRAAGTWRQD